MARSDRADQHAAENVAARAGRHAGHRHLRADPLEGGEEARPRSGRGPQDQRAGRQRAVRPRAAQRQAGVRDERVRQGSARQGPRAVPVGREEGGATAARSRGTKARGIGVAVSPYAGGSIGFDGLFIIKPDGRIQFQSGIGNLGTHSVFDVHRAGGRRCSACRGSSATSSSATRRRTCRGPASRPAARRRTR